jgi:uncharacterized membrane protein YbhN (UPF0104 family)
MERSSNDRATVCPAQAPDSHKAGVRRGLQCAIAATVLVAVLWHAGWQSTVRQLAGLETSLLVVTAALCLADGLIRVWNWQKLLVALSLRVPRMYRRLLSCHYAGTFVGCTVPSTAGTDVVRAALATNALGGHLAFHTAPLLTLNVLNLCGGSVLGLLGLALLAGTDVPPALFVLSLGLFSCVLCAGVAGFIALRHHRPTLLWCLRRLGLRWFWLRRIARKFFAGLGGGSLAAASLAPIFASSIVTQALRALAMTLVAHALGVDLPLGLWFVVGPLTKFSGLLSFSILGFGGDQAVLVFLLAPFHVDPSLAVAASLAYAATAFATNVVFGALVFVLGARHFVATPEPAPPPPRAAAYPAPQAESSARS